MKHPKKGTATKYKYYWDNIKKEVIDHAESLEELIAKEYDNIVKYQAIRNGYNLTENTRIGGDNWAGRKNTPEYYDFIEKMRSYKIGRAHV